MVKATESIKISAKVKLLVEEKGKIEAEVLEFRNFLKRLKDDYRAQRGVPNICSGYKPVREEPKELGAI